ncbi:hypothetical protein [Azotobacter vinelandii]
MSTPHDVAVEAVKAAPPVAVSSAMLLGLSPADWITVLTLVYLLLQIGLLIPKYWAKLSECLSKEAEK